MFKKYPLYIAITLFSLSLWAAIMPEKPYKEPPDFVKLRQQYSQEPSQWPAPNLSPEVEHRELGLMPDVTYPEDNPYSREKAELGKLLFFDPRLSKSGQIACASCHDPELGWGDGRRTAFGHDRQRGKRNASTILNVAFAEPLFWDGRAHNLEHQATFPIQDNLEMSADLEKASGRLNKIAGYRQLFKEVFGQDSITMEAVSKALATFQRGITSRKSRFDLFLEGRSDALNDQELWGLHLFRTKARCLNCHNGALFSDNQFHNDGFAFFGRRDEDLGRYEITEKPQDMGAFRTPSLRDVMFTDPWMHNGVIREITEIIDMYNLGMPQFIPSSAKNREPKPEVSPLLKPLNLSKKEKKALIAFLGAISTRPHIMNAPELPK